MTASPQRPPGSTTTLAAFIILLLIVDVALMVIGMLIWAGHQRGHLSTTESATFLLLGASAAAGALIYLLTAGALMTRARVAARLATGLAWLRTGAVLLVLAIIVIRFGSPAVAGTLPTSGAAFALTETLIAAAATTAASHRIDNNP